MASYTETSREDELSLSSGLSWQAAAELCLAETSQGHSIHIQDISPKTQALSEAHSIQRYSESTPPYTDYSTPNRFTSVQSLLVSVLDATYKHTLNRILSEPARNAYQNMAFLCLDECASAQDTLEAQRLLSTALVRLQPIVKSKMRFTFVDTTKYHRMAIEHALDLVTCINRRFVQGGGWVNNCEKDENMFVECAIAWVKKNKGEEQ